MQLFLLTILHTQSVVRGSFIDKVCDRSDKVFVRYRTLKNEVQFSL